MNNFQLLLLLPGEAAEGQFSYSASGGATAGGAATAEFTSVPLSVEVNSSDDVLTRTANIPTAACTISGWFKWLGTGDSTWAPLFCLDDETNADALYFYNIGGTTAFSLYSGSSATSFSAVPTSGTWYYVALTRASNLNLTAYIWNASGTLIQSVTKTTAGDRTDTTVGVGCSGWAFEWLGARFKYIRVWDAELSQSELESELESETPVRSTSINTAFDYDGTDVSGNGRNWTNTGTVTSSDVPTLPSGTNNYSHSASGGAVAGGEATETLGKVYLASGGAVTGGDATEVYTAGAVDFPYSASGGASTGGTATVLRTLAYSLIASGGVVALGAAAATHNSYFEHSSSGGALTSGSATVDWNPNPTTKYWAEHYWNPDYWGRYWPLAGSSTQDYPHTASGGADTGGESAHFFGRVFQSSGGALTGGDATEVLGKVYSASGGAVSSGSATVSGVHTWSFSASGGAVFSGSADVSFNSQNDYTHVATGGLEGSGAATIARTVAAAYTASGGGVAGGLATSFCGKVYQSSGGSTSGGSASCSLALSFQHISNGGSTLAGAASVIRHLEFVSSGGAVAEGEAFAIYQDTSLLVAKERRFLRSFTSPFTS